MARGLVKTHYELRPMESISDVSFVLRCPGELADIYEIFKEIETGSINGRVVIDLR